MLAAAVDDRQVLLVFVGEVGIPKHQLAESQDGIQRGAKFAAHVGQEGALGPVGGLAAGLYKLADVTVDDDDFDLLPTGEHMYFVGIDVGKRHHQAVVIDEQCELCGDTTGLSNTRSGIESLLARLEGHDESVRIALESS